MDRSSGGGTIDDDSDELSTLREARCVLGAGDVPSSANTRALPVSKHDYNN